LTRPSQLFRSTHAPTSSPRDPATANAELWAARGLPRIGALVAGLGVLLGLGACSTENTTSPLIDCGGTRLLIFASDRGQTGQYDVMLYDLDGSGFRLLQGLNSKVVDNLNPAITSDAQYVAFVSAASGGAGGDDIQIYDRCAAAFSTRGSVNSSGDEGDPAFTYDGLNLAFVRDTLGQRRIRMLHGPSDKLVALPGLEATGFDDHSPSPNVDGTIIAFVSNRAGSDDVFVYDAAGDSVRNIPDLASSADDVDPWLTPNGRWLAFASNRSGGSGDFDIYLYDLQLSSFVTTDDTLNTASVERNPTLSNDADLIVFQSDRTGTLGRIDLWNSTRSTGTVGRSPGESSAGDDIQPCLVWP
jgi:Tol biopolymer transport system component